LGAEQALTALLKIVIAYFLLVQLIPILILAPIFNSRRYDWAFRDQDQGTNTGNGAWYVAFNVVAAFTKYDFPASRTEVSSLSWILISA
jgi:hypothetical protein